MKIKNALIVLLMFLVIGTLFAQDHPSSAFSNKTDRKDVTAVLKAVADWQINQPLVHEPADWTNAALYAGMAEWASIAGTDRYYEWLKAMADKCSWDYFRHDDPRRRYHADDYCVGQVYIELYRKYRKAYMLKPIRTYLNSILRDPPKGDLEFVNTDNHWSTERWSWCDALFMGPTVWAKMAAVTGKQKYLDFMYTEYKATTDYLFDKEEHLYYRDSNYFNKKEANGEKVFWGRGNGWVFAGLPIIIRELPEDYVHKDNFVNIFREMAARLKSLQTRDGSWHASLLDPSAYPNPEMSATAFFIFGMAWGVANGYLDRDDYLPVIKKGWKSMVASVWPDGKVGYIQPIGADPKSVTRDMTEVYGVGGFLMAGTEIVKLIDKGIL